MLIRLFSLLILPAAVFVSHSASANTESPAPGETSTSTTQAKVEPQLLSQEDFVLQKAFMVQDTATKVKVLQAAHDCAKAAETPAAFAACNQQLREAILGGQK